MRPLSIRTKLTLALSFILLASFLAVSIINFQVSRSAIRDVLLTSALPLTGENIYSEIHADLMEPIFVSSLMANDTFLKDWTLDGERNTEHVVKYLKEIKNRYGYFTSFFVSAKTLKYYYFDGILKTVAPTDAHDVWYYTFVDSGLEYRLDVDTNQAENNRLTIFINYRVKDYDGSLLGVAGVGLNIDRVAELLAAYQTKYERAIYMVDPHGVVQAHSDKSLIQHHSIRDVPGLAGLTNDILTPRNEPVAYEYDSAEGNHVLLSVRYLPDLDWFLMVEQDEGAALSSARRNLFRTLVVGLLASMIIIALCIAVVNHFQSRMELMATTDSLSGLYNRRAFETFFEQAVYRAKRQDTPFSLLLFDLDRFKEINDTYGHLAGDRYIVTVAELLKEHVRVTDQVARWGGDEFLVLVEGDRTHARQVADRIRQAVAKLDVGGLVGSDSAVVPTVSCGVAAYNEDDSMDTMTARADAALYEAKNSGRNLVCMYED